MFKKLLIAFVIYFLLGIVWIIGFNLSLGTRPADMLRTFNGEVILLILIWPIQILQALQLFGFSFS